MNLTEFLQLRVEEAYRATDGLIDMVDGDRLDWRPESGDNWMSTGQLLKHIETACGFCCRGFVTGEWGMPDGAEMSEDEMLPAADRMPSTDSVEATRAALAADKAMALAMIAEAGEDALANKLVAAPWNPTERALGFQFHECVEHLVQHKAQLFYYLKLQGKPVHTGTLWGM